MFSTRWGLVVVRAVLDMDPGHDDALALLAALGVMDVHGVTTVAGNQTLDKTTQNARRVLWASGRDLPVAPGFDRPWLVPLVTAANVHGESGLDGYAFPPLAADLRKVVGAMAFLRQAFSLASEPMHWIATGPLTNVASFLAGHPELRSRIASLTVMGGSLQRGNITPCAEFNIYVDPEAAQYVFDSGLTIRVVGLDVTHQALMTPEHLSRFRDLRAPVGEMLFSLLSYYGSREAAAGGFPIHDVLAVAARVEPGLFTWRTMSLQVGPRDAESRGATRARDVGPPVDVAMTIDRPGFFEWLWKALSVYH